MLVEQVDEVSVLGHDDNPGVSGRMEDLKVGGPLQFQVTDRDAIDRERGAHPRDQRRRQLIVEPERHAATIG